MTITFPAKSTIAIGESNTDTAVVLGTQLGGTPTGFVDFYLCPDIPCASGGDFVGSGEVNITGAATSPEVFPTEPGKYCFRGEYLGDTTYLPSEDSSPDECFLVLRAESSVLTSPSAAVIVLGASVTDGATVQGNDVGGVPTGNVTFHACLGGLCGVGGTLVGSAAIDAGGNATSPPFTPDELGLWCFRGAYEGDARYNPSQDASLEECFDVVAPLCAPEGAAVQALAGPPRNVLTWNATAGASGYNVLRSDSPLSPFTIVNTTSDTTFVDFDVTPGTAYTYRLEAILGASVTPHCGNDLQALAIPELPGPLPQAIALAGGLAALAFARRR